MPKEVTLRRATCNVYISIDSSHKLEMQRFCYSNVFQFIIMKMFVALFIYLRFAGQKKVVVRYSALIIRLVHAIKQQ